MIALAQVSKTFTGKRDVVALHPLDLTIPKGEMVAIIGASGSGKSTLLNLIGGLDHPTTGVISVDGRELGSLSDDELTRVRRDKIGFVFQFFNLLPSLSCLENVSLPLHLRGWQRQKIYERATELLRLVGLEKRMDHLPDELSGGERQRVAVARALVTSPAVVLADEPTGNLDHRTGDRVFGLMVELNAETRTSLVIVTHDLARARSMDRVLQMEDGRLHDVSGAVTA